MYSDDSDAKHRAQFQFKDGKTSCFFIKLETKHVRLFMVFAKLVTLSNMYQNT